MLKISRNAIATKIIVITMILAIIVAAGLLSGCSRNRHGSSEVAFVTDDTVMEDREEVIDSVGLTMVDSSDYWSNEETTFDLIGYAKALGYKLEDKKFSGLVFYQMVGGTVSSCEVSPEGVVGVTLIDARDKDCAHIYSVAQNMGTEKIAIVGLADYSLDKIVVDIAIDSLANILKENVGDPFESLGVAYTYMIVRGEYLDNGLLDPTSIEIIEMVKSQF